MTSDELEALREEYEERAAIIADGCPGASRATSERRAWKRLLEREGPQRMRELRDHLAYRPLREAK